VSLLLNRKVAEMHSKLAWMAPCVIRKEIGDFLQNKFDGISLAKKTPRPEEF
jgi:hypothetical protein